MKFLIMIIAFVVHCSVNTKKETSGQKKNPVTTKKQEEKPKEPLKLADWAEPYRLYMEDKETIKRTRLAEIRQLSSQEIPVSLGFTETTEFYKVFGDQIKFRDFRITFGRDQYSRHRDAFLEVYEYPKSKKVKVIHTDYTQDYYFSPGSYCRGYLCSRSYVVYHYKPGKVIERNPNNREDFAWVNGMNKSGMFRGVVFLSDKNGFQDSIFESGCFDQNALGGEPEKCGNLYEGEADYEKIGGIKKNYLAGKQSCSRKCWEMVPYLLPGEYLAKYDKVRMRDNPSLKSKIIRELPKNEKLTVTEDTGKIEEIDEDVAPWVKARLSDGTEGYIYGILLKKPGEFYP